MPSLELWSCENEAHLLFYCSNYDIGSHDLCNSTINNVEDFTIFYNAEDVTILF